MVAADQAGARPTTSGRPATTTSPIQSCDDATAQAANYDTGKCSQNGNAYAATTSCVGVIGTFNSPCAAIIIPLLNKAKGGVEGREPGGDSDDLAGEHVAVPDGEPAGRLRGERAGQVLSRPGRGTTSASPRPTTTRARSWPSTPRLRASKKAYILNDKESYGLGVAGTTGRRPEHRRHRDRRRRGLEPEGVELRGPDEEDRGHGCGRGSSSAASSPRTAVR